MNKPTLHACYRGYVVQAVNNNLSPILFLTFSALYGIPVQQLSLLILLNFATQIAADLFSVFFIDRIGIRRGMLMAHACATGGLVALAVLPSLMPAFPALCIATMVAAWGGGVLEVLVSPVVDGLPGEDGNSSGMSLLHSFYCWGQVLTVLATTLLLRLLGDGLWQIIPALWALLPIYNFVRFLKVPLPEGLSAGGHEPVGGLLRNKMFLLALVLMVATGASELGMSQWSSAFAEAGLGVDKTLGDLLGPCLFAVFMGAGRTIYGVWGERIPLRGAMAFCGALGVASYLVAALSPWPLLALVGCAACGFAVSLFWPGMFSLCAKRFNGGTGMFGIMAIMGDIGCSLGPWMVGMVAGASGGVENLATGLLAGSVFPLIMFLGVLALRAPKAKV